MDNGRSLKRGDLSEALKAGKIRGRGVLVRAWRVSQGPAQPCPALCFCSVPGRPAHGGPPRGGVGCGLCSLPIAVVALLGPGTGGTCKEETDLDDDPSCAVSQRLQLGTPRPMASAAPGLAPL